MGIIILSITDFVVFIVKASAIITSLFIDFIAMDKILQKNKENKIFYEWMFGFASLFVIAVLVYKLIL